MNKKDSSVVDPFVKVQIYGVPADASKKETSVVDNNGNLLRLAELCFFVGSVSDSPSSSFVWLQTKTPQMPNC